MVKADNHRFIVIFKLNLVIRAHISDSSFSIESLGDELGINCVHLHRLEHAARFRSHQYFTNCFKDFYGFAPADYAEKYREEKISPV